MAKQRVAVLFGGASKDHFVSLKSAYSVLNGLSKDKYEIIPIGITKAGRWLYYPGDYSAIPDGSWENDSDCCSAILSPDPIHSGIIKILADGDTTILRVDVVFSVIHGKYGECGRIQGLCRLAGIAFVGSEMDAANACTDKTLTHLILDNAGIKTLKCFTLERNIISNIDEHIKPIESKINYPVYVKAASCSSSIGANIASNYDELKSALKIAFSHHNRAIIEETVNGKEIECIVFGNTYGIETSTLGEVKATPSFIDDNSSYVLKSSSFVIPAEVNSDTEEKIKEIAVSAYKAINCKGFARIDFCVTENDIYCVKICNMPGFAEENIFPMLMKTNGYSYSDLLETIINFAVEART